MDYETPQFDSEQYDTDARMRFLEAKVAFLQDEVSQMRSLMRHLIPEKKDELPIFNQTTESFDTQWKLLPEGHAMLSNEEWRKNVTDTISRFTDLPQDWFKGKNVLDAGCGQGRWTYGFGKLDAQKCISFDISETGVSVTRKVAKEFGERVQVYQKNILEDLSLSEKFDIVWCFGVLHHTGNTYKGFQNIVKYVRPGGYLFMMLYGEPRPNDIGDYSYYHDIFDMRCKTKNLTFEEKVRKIEGKYGREYLHGYFDAISPEINDLYRWDEIVSWLISAGFEDIKRTLKEHPNHHVVARKKVTQQH